MSILNKIRILSFVIVYNYFLLYGINGLLGMVGMASIAKFDLLIMLAATVIAFSYLRKYITKLDVFIIIFIGIIAFTSLLNKYNYELWYSGCRQQLYTTIFFFVGRHPNIQAHIVFRKGIVPFLCVCIIGLILYVTLPSWYMDYKLQMWQEVGDISDNRILEMTRLSAFWPYPYWVSYGCAIMYIYIMINCYMKRYMNRIEVLILIFIAFIALLTQQRAPIFTIALLTVVFIIGGQFRRKKYGYISLRSSIFYFILLSISMFVFFITFIDYEMLERLLGKIELLENISVFLNERSDIFSDFYTKKITLFGDGIGRYSHAAYALDKQAITDQQYMQLMYETGYFGCIGYGIILLNVLFRGIKHLSSCYIELGIIMFFLMAMTGANCLSNFVQHTAIFWMCCGYICNRKFSSTQIKTPSTIAYSFV